MTSAKSSPELVPGLPPRGLSRRAVLARAGAAALPSVILPSYARTAAVGAAGAGFDPERDPTEGRRLLFEDAFQTLDRSVWNAGPKAGTAEPGFYGRAAFARWGGEAGFDPYAIVDDPEAQDGKALQISVKHIGRTMQVPDYYGNALPEFQWVGGNLQAARRDGTVLKGWRQGYFETRMRFPEHPLTWPAFWLLNARSILTPQTSIEIDVVEHKGFEPHVYGAYLHEWGNPGERHQSSGVTTGPDMTRGYNLYGVRIEGGTCVVYFNRSPIRDPKTGAALVWTLDRAAEMDASGDVFWPLLTLALRSDYQYPDPLRPEDRQAAMQVDYFRVYG